MHFIVFLQTMSLMCPQCHPLQSVSAQSCPSRLGRKSDTTCLPLLCDLRWCLKTVSQWDRSRWQICPSQCCTAMEGWPLHRRQHAQEDSWQQKHTNSFHLQAMGKRKGRD